MHIFFSGDLGRVVQWLGVQKSKDSPSTFPLPDTRDNLQTSSVFKELGLDV